jgi:FKBP-type peptidyl-prolyl cis-trans isomerase 2
VKKTWISTAALSAAALLALAGCSSAGPDASPSASLSADASANNALLDAVEWTEDADGVPALTFAMPLSLDATAARLVADGDGEPLEEGQVVTLTYTVTDGTEGTVAFSTYETGTREPVTLSETQLDPVILEALDGAHVGADFIYGAIGSAEDPGTVLMAVTVDSASTPLAAPEGEAVAPVAGLPVVTLDDTGKPSAEITETEATEMVAQPLIAGTGDVVETGDVVTVNYSGWLTDGTQFDSSWDRGAPASFQLADGQVIDGWIEGLVGQTVGSQVLLVIPSDKGYGEDGSSSIPGGATLVFVVDILAAQ